MSTEETPLPALFSVLQVNNIACLPKASAPQRRLAAVVIAALLVPPCAHAANEAVQAELSTVTVIATAPLPGLGLAKEHIPAAVQTANSHDIASSGALDISDFLNRSMGSVYINEAQGNPFMADVNYRGYTASPLLGTPQGLSVYLDGVRLNQPFGDVVMWDLIPKSAIASVNLMAGSNPLFGLNTLGGALSMQTKDGLKNPGTAVEMGAGSVGRKNLQLEHGGATAQGLDWFVIANAYGEAGWRADSPSRLGQLFGKLGWQDTNTQLSLSYAHSNNSLNGNGMQMAQMLAVNPASVYTKPDTTANRADFLNLQGRTAVSDQWMLSGNAYYRNTRTATTNGDLNEGALGKSVYYTGQADDAAWLATHGYGTPVSESTMASTSTTDAFPIWRCIAQAGRNSSPNDLCTGFITTSVTRQQNMGLSGQLTVFSDAPGVRHQAMIGAAVDTSRTRFRQASQFGYLNADRSITPVGAFADGTQDSPNTFDQRVNLNGGVRTWSLFGTDTLTLHDVWHLTVSGRYNHTRLNNSDTLYPYNNATTLGEQRGSLSGNHRFRRFNPALGASYAPSSTVNAYAGYSENSRTPTSIELGCADPAFGCRLPNAMAGDPPLNPVVSKTWEAGIRGQLNPKTHWTLGVFRGDNSDEILFVANSASTGYFKNVGKTRRQGLEASLATRLLNTLSLSVNYTALQATYQTTEHLRSPYNSSADASDAITINPGDRIPLVPHHILKIQANYAIQPRLTAGLNLIAISGSRVRGNDNASHAPDNLNHVGSGRVPGYSVVNTSISYQPATHLTWFANVANVFNQRYATIGQLGPYALTSTGGYRNSDASSTSFYTPGAPRALWLGARYVFI
jgi:outer membrane receptor protein involved in Fe transport